MMMNWTRAALEEKQGEFLPLVTVTVENGWKDNAGVIHPFVTTLQTLSRKEWQSLVVDISAPLPPTEVTSASSLRYRQDLERFEERKGGRRLVACLQAAGNFSDLDGSTLDDQFADLCSLLPSGTVIALINACNKLAEGGAAKFEAETFRNGILGGGGAGTATA